MKNRRKFIASTLSAILLTGLLWPVPEPLFDHPRATVVLSREGHLLGARIADDGQWRFPPVDSLPANYVAGLLAYEDQYFYRHPGINPVSIIRAVITNVKAGRIVSGGSTITMQVARMALGNQPRTIPQKLYEMWLAMRIELKYSKDEILRLYANNAPFGGNVVGIPAAAWRYYGRSSFQLSWAEAANLVVLPNAPGLIFPGKNSDALIRKRNRVLKLLADKGFIDDMTYTLSLQEPLPQKPLPLPMTARHLLDRAISEGHGRKAIKTTLDYNIQSIVNKLVNDYHLKVKFKQIHNTAAIVADIKTGEVLAYVGNVADDGSGDHGQEVDIITSRRSPGSLLKPVLYALAVDQGLITPYQLLPDIPVRYQGFTPKNFDKQYRGAVQANKALRSSLNVPFVSLLRDYGYEQFHHELQKLGIRSLDKPPGHYGLSLILGSGEVTLWEMAGLYASMARTLQTYNAGKGEKRYNSHDFRALTWVPAVHGKTAKKSSESRIGAAALWHTLRAMQELHRPDEESNWQRFTNSRSIAWKTGTSYGHKDAWAIGLSSGYVVGVWLGNADGEGRPDLTGVQMAAPLMFRIFDLLDGDARFREPVAATKMMKICKLSGYRAGYLCDEVLTLPVSVTSSETDICPYHKILHLDADGKMQVTSACYPVSKMVEKSWFVLPPAQAWYYKKYHADYKPLPEFMAGCAHEGKGFMEMIYPRGYAKVYVPYEIDGERGKVVFEAAHRDPGTKIFWYLDEEYVGETIRTHQMGLFPTRGRHLLSLVDEQGRELEVSFEAVNRRN